MSAQEQNRKTNSRSKMDQGSQGSTSDSNIQDIGVKAQMKTNEILDQVQEKVGDTTDKVKEQATSQVSSQKDKAADSLGSVAQAIRQTGEQMRQNDQAAPVAQYTDQLAQGVEMVSNYLKNHSVSEIFGEVERFARREPALFLGGALTLGLLGGRFLRTSGTSGTQSQSGSNSYNSSPMRNSGQYGSGNYSSSTYGSGSSSYGSSSTYGSGTYSSGSGNYGSGSSNYSSGSGSSAHGSRSTGYSNGLSTGSGSNYGSYGSDMDTENTSLTENPNLLAPGTNSSNSGIYSGIPNTTGNRMRGSNEGLGTTGYQNDSFGSESSERYGTQTGNTGPESGGSTGVA